jgi:hypothetical protein
LQADRIIYKYSCKIPIGPKSVVISVGAYESATMNPRNMASVADGVFGDEVECFTISLISSS